MLALPLDAVREVFRMVAVAARLPRAPRTCLGVCDFHGQLVPLIDLGARLGLTPPREEIDFVDGHVLLVDDSVGAVGYVVDEVRELVESPAEVVEAAGSQALGKLTVGAVRCSDGTLAPLLEHGSLLTLVAREMLRNSLSALDTDGDGS
jgi:two-component system chemotaxis response regulator CheV